MKLNQTMTLAALVAAGLLAGSLALQAQESTNTSAPATPPPAHGRHMMSAEQIAQKLGLSEDVTAKFKAIWEDRITQMQALRTDTTVADTDKRKKAKEIMDASTAKLKEILTQDQMEQLKKLMPMGQRRAPMAPGGIVPAAPAQN